MHPNIKRWEEGMNICKGKKIKINNRYALSQTEVQVYEHCLSRIYSKWVPRSENPSVKVSSQFLKVNIQ